MNPATATTSGLMDGEPARISTPAGAVTMIVAVDHAMMPGVLYAVAGPSPNKTAPLNQPEAEGILSICSVNEDGTWRTTEATIAKA
jgi:anaerobic selenocysteine-containing dehydrogenase